MALWPAAIAEPQQPDEDITLSDLGAAEIICLPVTGAELLHAYTVPALEAIDGFDDRRAILVQVPCSGAEEKDFRFHEQCFLPREPKETQEGSEIQKVSSPIKMHQGDKVVYTLQTAPFGSPNYFVVDCLQ